MAIDIKKLYIVILLISILFIIGPINNYLITPLILFLSVFFFCLRYNYNYSILKLSFNKVKEYKIINYFILWALFSFFINYIFKQISITRFIIGGFFGYFVAFILFYIIGLLLPFYVSISKIIKLIISILYIILIYGIFEFVLCKMNSSLISLLLPLTSGRDFFNVVGYKFISIPRIQSFFNEPSTYAWFLVCNIPLALTVFLNRNSKYLDINKIIKITVLPLLLISIILTQSPINIIFALIVLLAYSILTMKITIKDLCKYILTMIFFIILLVILISYGQLSDSILSRVKETFAFVRDINTFVVIEPSLANRIISYVNMFIIFMKNPIFGVSCGNLVPEFVKQISISPIILTEELVRVQFSSNPSVNPSITFKLLAETGIVGFSLFMLFIYSIYKKTRELSITNLYFYKDYFSTIGHIIIIYVCLTIYDSNLYCHYFWFLFGTISGIYLKQKIYQRKFVKNDGCFDNIS